MHNKCVLMQAGIHEIEANVVVIKLAHELCFYICL
jgi:hypothetical protein